MHCILNACLYCSMCDAYINDTNTVAAPTGDEELTSRDAHRVLDELLDAQTKSIELGRALKIPENILDGIHKRYPAYGSLHCVIGEFLKQKDPKPTWRAIVAALKSTEVNLPELARKIEAAHCHSPAATHGTLPETTNLTALYILP